MDCQRKPLVIRVLEVSEQVFINCGQGGPLQVYVKDGKIVAVEVESTSHVDERKIHKYEALGSDSYDDVVWHAVGEKTSTYKGKFEIVGKFARVPVWSIRKHNYRNRIHTVYNLTVADNQTYVAGNILVHNCYSFQAIKHVTTGDGGALICRSPKDFHDAKCLKWFGLDRDRTKDEKGNRKI